MGEQSAPVTQFAYEGAVYDVTKTPAGDSKIVADMKAEVLGGVRLDKLAHNLAITGDLIYLAYNATPPKYGDLRGQIDTLHIRFGDICGECVTELRRIRSGESGGDGKARNRIRVHLRRGGRGGAGHALGVRHRRREACNGGWKTCAEVRRTLHDRGQGSQRQRAQARQTRSRRATTSKNKKTTSSPNSRI